MHKGTSRVIFDIETVGRDFDSLDQETQQYFLKSAETEEEEQEIRDSLSLYPQTSAIIAIGLYNPDTQKGVVHYQAPEATPEPFEEEGIQYRAGDERAILQSFWEVIPLYREFVTFNGRTFDCPFILIRSAVHRIRPKRDLMPNRYNGPHIDLMDQLSFFGATRRRFSLDIWCRTFGIRSPKEDGIKGQDVRRLFAEKRYLDIARYCARDIRATAELLTCWEGYIKFQPSR
ncbi:MAG: ribonuclease H-like domain-containing protein [bacterium]